MTRARDYQQTHIDAAYQAWEQGLPGPASILATGLGKGNLIGALARPQTLCLAERDALVTEMAHRVKAHYPGQSVGIVMAEQDETRREVVCASVPTVRNPGRRTGMVKPRLVIVDEAHHAAAPGYIDVLEWAGCFDEVDPTPYYGLTATMIRGAPPRKGQKGLGDVWRTLLEPQLNVLWGVTHGPAPWDDHVTVGIEENGGIGWLARPRGVAVRLDHVDLEQVGRDTKGDYRAGEVGDMVRMDAPQAIAGWVKHAVDEAHPLGRITIAFWPNKETARSMCEAFSLAGIPSKVVLSGTSRTERGDAKRGTGIYGQLARGEVRIVHSVGVLTEGFDLPEVECVLWGRPTVLPGLYIQCAGRGLRPAPWVGKTDCLLIDLVGTSRKLSLVLAPQLLPGMEYDATEIADAEPCPNCQFPIELCQCEPEERAGRVDRRPVLLQPQYEEVDLFAATDWNWQVTVMGHRFLSVIRERQYVVLFPEADGTVSVGLMNRRGNRNHQGWNGRWLHERLSPSLAQRLAEAAAEELGQGGPGMKRTASWRIGRASMSAVDMAKKWRIADAEQMTAGRLADEIDRLACGEAMLKALSAAA